MNSENWIKEYKDRRLWEDVVEYLKKFHNDILEDAILKGNSISNYQVIEILLKDIKELKEVQ